MSFFARAEYRQTNNIWSSFRAGWGPPRGGTICAAASKVARPLSRPHFSCQLWRLRGVVPIFELPSGIASLQQAC